MSKEFYSQITAERVGFDLSHEAFATARLLRDDPNSTIHTTEIVARNLRTYESESLEDSVASFYPYYLFEWEGQKSFFIAPEQKKQFLARASIDKGERGGKALSGFIKLEDEVAKLPGRGFFLWVSPKGRAGDEGIFRHINYRYHQVYMGETDGKVTGAVALKSDLDPEILSEWIARLGGEKPKDLTPESFLETHVVSGTESRTHAIAVLREIMEEREEYKFYKNTPIGQLPDVLKQEKYKQDTSVQYLTGRIFQEMGTAMDEMRMRDIIGEQLMAMFGRYQDKYGNIRLTGCAGGTISINSLLGQRIVKLSPLSTEFRVRSLGELLHEDEDFEPFHCPDCQITIQAKVRGDNCPACGYSKAEFIANGGEAC